MRAPDEKQRSNKVHPKRGSRRNEEIGVMHAQGENESVGIDTGSIETDRITFEFTALVCQGHRLGSAQ